jgi:hypothetical protein
MLTVAFKEWAAVCRALAEGRQSLILRKGGIAEENGEFRPEHPRFWLYPTYFHAQESGLVPDANSLIAAALANKPPTGILRLTHFAEVTDVHFVDTLDTALALEGLHVWSSDTIHQRFHYRTPGLYVLTVRVFRAETPIEVPEHPAYAGCKTWVELDSGARDLPATPVIDDDNYIYTLVDIGRRLSTASGAEATMVNQLQAVAIATRFLVGQNSDVVFHKVWAKQHSRKWLVSFEKTMPPDVVESPGSYAVAVDVETGQPEWFYTL